MKEDPVYILNSMACAAAKPKTLDEMHVTVSSFMVSKNRVP